MIPLSMSCVCRFVLMHTLVLSFIHGCIVSFIERFRGHLGDKKRNVCYIPLYVKTVVFVRKFSQVKKKRPGLELVQPVITGL